MKPPTTRARMKLLIEELRFAQMRVRLDIKALERSKQAVKIIAAKMKELKIDSKPNDSHQ